jgi:glycosyltransferase involved in cell wall biosynthesis
MIYNSIKEMTTSESKKQFAVVVPTYNNPSYLSMMLKQLLDNCLGHIVIVDNNSTIQGMKNLLKDLSQDFTVISKKTNDGPTEFYNNKEFYNWLPDLFIITDPDIGFNKNMPKDFVDVMREISEKNKLFRVGLALDIEMKGVKSNIKEIIFRGNGSTMYEWESQFWRTRVGETKYGDEIYSAKVDTTFCLVNKSNDKKKYYGPGVRIAGNFTAQHYGWYNDPPIPENEHKYYLSKITTKWSETGNALNAFHKKQI